MPTTTHRILTMFLISGLLVDPGFAFSARSGFFLSAARVDIRVEGILTQQAVVEPALPFLSSFADEQKAESFQITSYRPSAKARLMDRRRALRLIGSATLFAAYEWAVPLSAQSLTLDTRIRPHLNEVWRWLYAQINSRTHQAPSHPGDPALTRWSVVYDDAQRAMAHIQTGQIDLAKKTIDYFIETPGIRQPNGWIMNIIDSQSSAIHEYVSHSGPNIYLGIAAAHLYEVTKEAKYLKFAQERWELVKKLQNTNRNDFNYGAVPMSPRPGPDFSIDPKYQWRPNGPSFYELYNAEHNVDFKAFSDLLFDIVKDAKYKEASDLVAIWDRKMFDPKTKTFFWGTTTKAYHDQDFDVDVPVGILPFHPLDASALRLSAYGVNGLNALLSPYNVTAEEFRKAIDDQFKVAVTFTDASGQPVRISGYDFANTDERRRVVTYRDGPGTPVRRKATVGRDALASDEWATWVALGDLRFADDFQRMGNQAKANQYMALYKANAVEEALKTGVRTAQGIARPYAHPIPYSWNKPVVWGWNTPQRPAYSVIGNVARTLGFLASDPFLSAFGRMAQKIILQIPVRLAVIQPSTPSPQQILAAA